LYWVAAVFVGIEIELGGGATAKLGNTRPNKQLSKMHKEMLKRFIGFKPPRQRV
jgi:hypothetical protein